MSVVAARLSYVLVLVRGWFVCACCVWRVMCVCVVLVLCVVVHMFVDTTTDTDTFDCSENQTTLLRSFQNRNLD